MGDFSIANNLDANAAELQLERNQRKLSDITRRLSSGLRIQSAADDPSGLAISENLLDRVAALTTSSQNVATARNAAAVADGALATVTSVLLRIRSLAVEASSSIEDDGDRANVQAEIDSLVHEIDRISQNTNFNGQALLDGSHSGFQPAQAAQLNVTANTVLASATGTAGSNLLVQNATFIQGAAQPAMWFSIRQNVVASPNPQTVSASDTQYIEAGSAFLINGQLMHVQSVDPAAGTITAIFTSNVASGEIASPLVNANMTAAVSAGTQLVTVAGGAQPFYAGETLQVGYTSFATNDVIVVQKVISPTSFIAYFNKPQPSGTNLFSLNGTYLPANYGPGSFTYNYGGAATDSPPIGSTAYVIETSSPAFPPPAGATTRVVATGTVTGGSISSETVTFDQKVPNYFGGWFQLVTNLGLGTVPLVSTDDGTIKLNVVNTGVSIAVQETFYDTKTQTAVTSPFLLAPSEQAVLFDGVVTTLGTFTTADVGSTAYIKVQQATAAVTATTTPALSIHSGGDEGDNVQIGIPSVSAQSLRVSTLSVMPRSGSGDPTLAAEDTIGQVDYALARVLGIRATLGAQIVALSDDGSNDEIGAVQTQASESSVRDANVPADSAALALDQVDVQIGLTVLSQADNLPEQVLKLFR